MFKASRWRSEKNKIKAVFKLQFHATQVTQLEWEAAMVSLVPLDVGKPTSRSEKTAVIDGTCYWRKPIYETVKLIQDPKTGKINGKLYNFIVSATGPTKAAVLGEITIDLSNYAELFKPSSVSLPLKPPNSGPILHVTIQRVQADAERREADEIGDLYITEYKTRGLLKPCEGKEVNKVVTTNVNSFEVDLYTKEQAHRSGTMSLQAESHGEVRKPDSSDATSALGSYNSPEKYFRYHQTIVTDWPIHSAPDSSPDGSAKSLAESGSEERLYDSDLYLKKLKSNIISLARQLEVSGLELQNLRKQVLKETRHGKDLSRELSRMKEEKEALQRECEKLKALYKRFSNENILNKSDLDSENPHGMLEIKQELDHEKTLNANLRLQLQKTLESNSELVLAVRDLEELLEKKNKGPACINCSIMRFEQVTDEDLLLKKFEFSETNSEDNEQYALEVLVKGCDDIKVAYSIEQQIIDLNNEIELYKKDREDIEMHAEQLALDYEILNQENHEISSKLEQLRLREQLRMQYECSAHSTIISDLENQVKNLKNELDEQSEAFEDGLATSTQAKVEQEKRAIRAEEALRKLRWNYVSTAERLEEEFERLSSQMSSAFQINEKLTMKALTEASELNLQKCCLEELLEKTNEELAMVQKRCQVKVQELSNTINLKTKEADRLLQEIKDKSEELENQRKSEEAKQKAFSKKISLLKAEIERLFRENLHISEERGRNIQLVAEMEQLKTSINEIEMSLQQRNLEREMLDKELVSMKEEAEKSAKELNNLRHLKDEKDTVISTLTSEMTALRAEYNASKHSLNEKESEKENLRKQLFHLKSDLRKKEDAITNEDKKLKDSNARIASSNGTTKATIRNKNSTHIPTPHGSKEVASLHQKIKLLEEKIKLKEAAMEDIENSSLMKEKDLSNRIEELQKNGNQNRAYSYEGIAQQVILSDKENSEMFENETDASVKFEKSEFPISQPMVETKAGIYDINGINGGLTISSTTGTSMHDANEDLLASSTYQSRQTKRVSEMTVLKEKNEAMEAELKEMQERYSEISLKFAEVEGERQQLVMTVRTLKNALKN